MRAWLRLNRWWLVVLPVTIALLLAASAYRLKPYWYDDPDGKRVRATADLGEWLHWHNRIEGFDGWHDNDFRVRVLSVKQVDQVTLNYETGEVPAGNDAWAVEVEVEPVKKMDTVPCSITLVSADGDRYGGQDSRLAAQQLVCSGAPDGATGREARFTTTAVVLGKEDAKLTEVWLTVADPERLVWRLP